MASGRTGLRVGEGREVSGGVVVVGGRESEKTEERV